MKNEGKSIFNTLSQWFKKVEAFYPGKHAPLYEGGPGDNFTSFLRLKTPVTCPEAVYKVFGISVVNLDAYEDFSLVAWVCGIERDETRWPADVDEWMNGNENEAQSGCTFIELNGWSAPMTDVLTGGYGLWHISFLRETMPLVYKQLKAKEFQPEEAPAFFL